MLRRIKIQGYKSLVDLELNLEPLTVLVGPNASGKSNFLDALQLLSRVASSRTLKNAFEPPYRGRPLESFTFGDKGIKSLLERESVSFSIEVDVQLSDVVVDDINQRIQKIKRTVQEDKQNLDNPVPRRSQPVQERYLRYQIEIEMRPQQGILRVADENLSALNDEGQPKQNMMPFLIRVENQLHLQIEGQTQPLYFERYLDCSILSMPHYPPHHPHLVAMSKELANWLTFYLEPREQMRLPNPVKAVHDIGSMGEDLAAYLNTLHGTNKKQFESIEKSLTKMIPSITGIDVSVNELGEVELDLREGEKRISARVISEGTLRILGLLALVGAEEPPVLIGFEEPENGIHPRRIQRIARFLETRMILQDIQFIVTTHSSLLPDLVPLESIYVCRKVNGSTEIEPFNMMNEGPFWMKSDIDVALNDEHALSPSERILRGDFDA